MRTRSAKKLAQRIDLHYFKHAPPLRRWRTILSIAAPLLGLLWLGAMAAAGSRAAFSSGPVSASHAFAEAKCEVCHVRDTSFRAHVGASACLTCHDAPAHALNQPAPPDCATCHREHKGRVALSVTADAFCTDCHGSLTPAGSALGDAGAGKRAPGSGNTASGSGGAEGRELPFVSKDPIARTVTAFPSGHPDFASAKAGAADPGTLAFNHAVHMSDDLRGPAGPEDLQCVACHKPEIARVSSKRKASAGLMAALNYEQQCARCHPLFFDERIEVAAPHEEPAAVRAFVERSLREYIARHPGDISLADPPSRRVPLNFPRPAEPPARTAAEWVERRTARAEAVLWGRTCSYCHQLPAADSRVEDGQRLRALPVIAPSRLTTHWMPKAAFDHAPHLMVECASCHAAQESRKTSDVLMPRVETCATCHAPAKGARADCVECHGYHDWAKAHPVSPRFKVTDFQ